MRTYKTNVQDTAYRKLGFLLPLLVVLALSTPAQAGPIEIGFTASISNDGGNTTDDIIGQFTLDSSLLWGIGVGAVNDIVDAGSAVLFGTTETADIDSAFTFVSAAFGSDFGALSIIADYGAGLFSLELASDIFFTTADVFDDLSSTLGLTDLRAFDGSEALGASRFVNLVGYSDTWQGALTSLSITQQVSVPEPAILWLLLIAVPGVAFWGRRCA